MSWEPESRKHPRVPTNFEAWVGGAKGKYVHCTVSNITAAGAQLKLDEHVILPARFALVLSRDAKDQRECQLVWRQGDQLGVRFIEPREIARAQV